MSDETKGAAATHGLDGLDGATTLRIVTRGRTSGREHAATVWFALVGASAYVAARHGPRSDWLRNALADPAVTVRAGRRLVVAGHRPPRGGP